MKLSALNAISPIDGRYSKKLIMLRPLFSEFAFLKYRLKVEISWIKKLSKCSTIKEVPKFNSYINQYLNKILRNFNEKDALKIKKIEKKINHDTKAIEYFLKKKIARTSKLKKISEFIHFACTSEDINNIAYAIILKKTQNKIIIPQWKKIINYLKKMSFSYRKIPFLAKTHGQPASTTTIGKEFANFVYRMKEQYKRFLNIKILGKMNGSVGNYNAHVLAYPNINWKKISKEFVRSFGIEWNPFTTQIEPHDYIVELCDSIVHFNNILINLNRDIWGYISLNYFKQKFHSKEVGSSTMPHKINPIDFENSEGNLGLSNALLNHMANKLPITRWQRDLSDSTVLRNLGVTISYSILAYQSLLNGLKKIEINKKTLLQELNLNWQILSEAIQIIMKKNKIKNSYEKIKLLTRGKKINKNKIKKIIKNLNLPKKDKNKLKKINPENYIGDAINIIDFLNE